MALNIIGTGGPFSLPPASFDIGTLRNALETAIPGNDSGRAARVAAALQAAKAKVGDTAVLNTLSLDTTEGFVGADTTALINGATDGSALTIAPAAPDGMTLSSGQRVMAGVPTKAGTYDMVLTETLAGAIGSPKQSPVRFTSKQATVNPTLGALSLSSSVATVGTAVSIAINGATAGSSLAMDQNAPLPPGLSLSSANRRITGTPTAAGAGTINIFEILAGATNSPRSTALGLTISDAQTSATIDNTPANSTLLGGQVSGFYARNNPLDTRFTALGA